MSISPYVQPHSSISSPSSTALLLLLLFFSTVDPQKQSMTPFHHNNSATHSLPPGPHHSRVFVCLCRPTTGLATLCVYGYECATVRIQGPPLIIFKPHHECMSVNEGLLISHPDSKTVSYFPLVSLSLFLCLFVSEVRLPSKYGAYFS